MAAQKARINFHGLVKDEELTSTVKQVAARSSETTTQRHTFSGARRSFREIQLSSDSESDSEDDESANVGFKHSHKLEGQTPDDTTSTPQQLLRLSLRNARLSMKLTGNEVDVEEFTQATRSSMQVEHEVEMYHDDVQHLSNIMQDFHDRSARIRALLLRKQPRQRTTSLPSSMPSSSSSTSNHHDN